MIKKVNWKYAIGEILIVIIGITIAFSLNNWKENRTNKKLKNQYLVHIAFDIQAEIKQLEQINQKFRLKIESIQKVLPYLGNARTKTDSIANTIFELANLIPFNPQNTTYNTLVNSGDLKLINNFNLLESMEKHYASHEQVMHNYERLENINEKYYGEFFITQIDYTAIAQGDYSFLEIPLLRNIVFTIQGSCYIAIKGNQECLESNKTLLQEIQNELSQ